ncbi:MAG: ammonia-forming cytochrome c nitrite reductase subunit c552, partial [Gammaproteobacteria bacterium]
MRSIALFTAVCLILSGCGDAVDNGGTGVEREASTGRYVGARVCGACHGEQFRRWSRSHHALAMQPATAESVLGDFAQTSFSQSGVETLFYRRAGRYFVRTDGADGESAEFPVRYTFGVHPLQQYIVELGNGRLQALGVAWDSRTPGEGGQRWFHVYGDEAIGHTDVLHWTRMSQNWDSMCADCHSTAVRKRFDVESGRFDTQWAEINVACEACHGPGGRHAARARAGGDSPGRGLAPQFDERRGVDWLVNASTGNSRRSRPRSTGVEIGVCAPCHSRRSRIADPQRPGGEFLDTYLPALLRPPLYAADGQVLDEVYVYGSFLQSRMYQQGVTCGDCHEPHGLELLAPDSRVCLQCHLDTKFATASHQLLPRDSTDIACVDCHMPATTYMQVDSRRDHSFRVPRPDLSIAYGTRNACNDCHVDKSAQWAADVLRAAGRAPGGNDHWVESLAAAQADVWAAGNGLMSLAANAMVPAIVRATAIAGLVPAGDAAATTLVRERAASSDPLIRWAVAMSLQGSHPAVITGIGPPMLNDPVRAVRMAATIALAPLDLELLPRESISDLQRGIDEYIDAQLLHAERAEAQVNIGDLLRRLKRFEQAEARYRIAMGRNPQFVGAYVNLADLFRLRGRDLDGEKLLRVGLARIPPTGQAALRYALGLTLVRLGRLSEAVEQLGMAAGAADADPLFALAYAL